MRWEETAVLHSLDTLALHRISYDTSWRPNRAILARELKFLLQGTRHISHIMTTKPQHPETKGPELVMHCLRMVLAWSVVRLLPLKVANGRAAVMINNQDQPGQL